MNSNSMDKTKNIYFVKLQGKANIPQSLEIDTNYRITADCSITQVKHDSNENGEYSVTYKAEPITVEITDSIGKTIKAKDPRKNSAKFRNYLWKLYYEAGYVEPFDEVYDAVILESLSWMEKLLEGGIKRIHEKS